MRCVRGCFLGVVIMITGPLAGASPVLLKSGDLPVNVEPEALQMQFDALSAMRGVEIEYSRLGPVSQVIGPTGVELPKSVREFQEGSTNTGLLESLGPMLLATGRESLVVKSNQDYGRSREIETDQVIRGIPVVGGLVSVSIDESTGEILAVVAAFLPDRDLPRKPSLTKDEAWKSLVHAFEASGEARPGSVKRQEEKPALAYHGVQADPVVPRLVWTFQVTFTCPTGRQDHETVWVDAIDGTVAGRRSNIMYVMSPGPCREDEREQTGCTLMPPERTTGSHCCGSCEEFAKVVPQLTVARLGCGASFRLTWPKIPGASQYVVERTPTSLGWAFARMVAAGPVSQCTTEVDTAHLVRLRAFGGCGSSQTSEILVLDPHAACESDK